MVCAINEMTDIRNLIYSVCEVLSLHDSPEFKRILHITTFFVTTFFVVACKDRNYFNNFQIFMQKFC